MKKGIICLLLASILIAFTACGESDTTGETDTSKNIDSPFDVTPIELENISGWWFIDENSTEAIATISVFTIDTNGTVVLYSNYGKELSGGSVRTNANTTGNFDVIMELDIFGEVGFYYSLQNGTPTLQSSDGSCFTPGVPLSADNFISEYVGTYYKDGDLNSSFIIFNNDGSYSKTTVVTEEYSFEEYAGDFTIMDSYTYDEDTDTNTKEQVVELSNGGYRFYAKFSPDKLDFNISFTSEEEHYSKNASDGGNTVSSNSLNARISMMTQEYIDDNIAEIPYFEYDGASNEALDSINRSLRQGIKQEYDDFMSQENEYGYWVELKTYPFTSENYLQAVVASIIYPSYGTDGEFFSVNYDIRSDKWLTNTDALDMAGMSLDDLSADVCYLYEPEQPSMYINSISVEGFLVQNYHDEEYIEFLLMIDIGNDEAEPWLCYYSYIPYIGTLNRLNRDCLFDAEYLDEMNPPLSYQGG